MICIITVIFVCLSTLEASAKLQCLGGTDPACYVSEDFSSYHEVFTRSGRSYHLAGTQTQKDSISNYLDIEEGDSTRSKRKNDNDGPDDQAAPTNTSSKKNSESETKQSKTGTMDEDDDEFSGHPKDLPFFPLAEGEIERPNLLIYATQHYHVAGHGGVKYAPERRPDDPYPPFTYHGFYSPKEWHKIPRWFFLPVTTKKIGKYSGHIINEKSGISFMNFVALHQKELKTMNSSDVDENYLEEYNWRKWGGVSSENCSNTFFPAPLDIITSNAKEDFTVIEFKFDNFDVAYSYTMFKPEDGTDLLFVKLHTPPGQKGMKPSIQKGAVLGNELFLDRISIHYGITPKEGSEHRINGKSFGMELQFFFNSQPGHTEPPYWTTLENYIIDDDPEQYGKNLLVLCVLVEVLPKGRRKYHEDGEEGEEEDSVKIGNKTLTSNKGLAFLARAAESFWHLNNEEMHRAKVTTKKVLKMNDFFSEPAKGLFYTYWGSLTHPPCLNNTRYSVFEQPIYISQSDWRRFLFIPSQFSDTHYMAGNYRPMDEMTYGTGKHYPNGTRIVVPYNDPQAKEGLSKRVIKSRKSTEKERLAEYDYYEEIPGVTDKQGNPLPNWRPEGSGPKGKNKG